MAPGSAAGGADHPAGHPPHASAPRQLAFILAGSAATTAGMAVLDKQYGLLQQPRLLVAAAFILALATLVTLTLRGLRMLSGARRRVAPFVAFLLLNLVTAGFLLAWRATADPTPLIVRRELDRGDALLRDGRDEEAHLVYQEAYKRFPNSYSVLVRMGSANYHVGFYDRAQRFFERALKVAPPDRRWQALNYLGQTYWKRREPELAIEYCERARREGMPTTGPEVIEWHYLLGWAYFDVKDYDKAAEHYRAVALAGEKYAAASWYNVACALSQKLRTAPPEERPTLIREAIGNLRQAWETTQDPDDRAALREGLAGRPDQLDPELASLRGTQEFRDFLHEVKSEARAN